MKTLIQSGSVTKQKKNLRSSSYITLNLFQLRYKALGENINNFNKKLEKTFEFIQESDELEIPHPDNPDKKTIDQPSPTILIIDKEIQNVPFQNSIDSLNKINN